MAIQEHIQIKSNQIKKRTKPYSEIEKPQRPLPMWCRGIMSGCINCGGCV